MKVENLTVEYQKSSLGLDKHAPRISWKLQDNRRNAGQSAYQIQVGRDKQFENLMVLPWKNLRSIIAVSVHGIIMMGSQTGVSRQNLRWQ